MRTLTSQAAILNGRAQAQVPISDEDLTRNFETAWPKLDSVINELKALDTTDFALWKEIERERQNVEELYERVKGAWWERIKDEGVGFFRINKDALHNTLVVKEGRFYDTNGGLWGTWDSEIARVIDEEGYQNHKTIIYLRHCKSTDRNKAWFHGFGKMRFRVAGGVLTEAEGEFYDLYASQVTSATGTVGSAGTATSKGPDTAVRKDVQLRRATEKEVETMEHGSDRKKQELASKVYKNWVRIRTAVAR